jgi:hypothetical protein
MPLDGDFLDFYRNTVRDVGSHDAVPVARYRNAWILGARQVQVNTDNPNVNLVLPNNGRAIVSIPVIQRQRDLQRIGTSEFNSARV